MSAVALAPPRAALAGRPFVGPVLDLMIVGGGLSLLVVLWVVLAPAAASGVLTPLLPFSLVLVNGAHFAASTARLYTRPGAYERWPFLTYGLPLASLAVIVVCTLAAGVLGRHLHALYFTWSPFHYAAQTYGLSAMYCARAGLALPRLEVRALRLACMLPFALAFVASPAYGIFWLLPREAIVGDPQRLAILQASYAVLVPACWIAPVLVFAVAWWRARRPWPSIVLVLMLSNASWWTVLAAREDAFGWAAVFHGLQYLAIVTVFHVRERPHLPAWKPGLAFYAACVAGGYAMFNCWPVALQGLGLGTAETVLVVTAVVNIHHFVVDAYIWKIRKDAPNAAVVAA